MKLLCVAILAVVLFASSPAAVAADKVNSLLATLSTAKAQVEGRAQRVQTCAALRDPNKVRDLRSKYDSARNHFNGRIDAWLFSLQKRKEFKFDAETEARELSSAIAKVNEFISGSDAALASMPCSTKVLWRESVLALIAIAPALVDSFKSFWGSADTTDSERNALIGALEQYRIAEWGGGAALVAFDFESQKFVTVSDEVARQASTAIYVNKWLLKDKPGAVVVASKLPPGPLSKDYLLFTGKPSEIDKLVLMKRE